MHHPQTTNAGTDTLRILDIRHSDGRMNGWPIDRSEVAPGDTAHIEILFNIQGNPGPRLRSGYIKSNDPVTPRVLVTVRAEVVR